MIPTNSIIFHTDIGKINYLQHFDSIITTLAVVKINQVAEQVNHM